MSKHNIVTCFANVLGKKRTIEILNDYDGFEWETRLGVERFCNGKTIPQCDFMTKDEHAAWTPGFLSRLNFWFAGSRSCTAEEVIKVAKFALKNNIEIDLKVDDLEIKNQK